MSRGFENRQAVKTVDRQVCKGSKGMSLLYGSLRQSSCQEREEGESTYSCPWGREVVVAM